MRSRLSIGLLVLLMVALFWPVSPIMAQMGFVSGEVLDADGNPMKDVTIRIEGVDTPRKYKLKTDKNGRYVHAGVSIQGTYRVIAEKEGFQSDYKEGVKPGFTRDEERGRVNFTLRKGQSGPLAFEMSEEELARMEKQREEAQKQAEKMAAVRGDFDEGINMFNAGQFDQAVAAFERVIAVDATQPVVWANLGASLSKLNDNQKAVDAYGKAIELDPQNAGYYQNQGSIYASMGNSEKARELYEKAASLAGEMNPKDAAVNYYNMGVTYINSGDNERAAESLTKALEFDPSHAESHYQLGITCIGLGRMDDAISHLKKYVELSPSSDNAEVARALIEQLGG